MSELYDATRRLADALHSVEPFIEAHQQALNSSIDPDTGAPVPTSTPPALVKHQAERITAFLSNLRPFLPTPPTPPALIRTRQHRTELMPPQIMEAYELLFITAYGSNAIFIGDPQSIHGTGKAQRGRTRSDQVETRGGAIQKKRLAASQKNTVLDQSAFNLKTRIDKRLRHLARDIYADLAPDANPTPPPVHCPQCNREIKPHYRFCPRCGDRMNA